MTPLWLTRYSKTHAEMVTSHFSPSFQACGIDKAFDLRLVEENYNAGEFGTHNFNEWGRIVMGMNLDLFKKNIGNIVVVSGCDIRFYADISKDIFAVVEKYEFAAIHDVFVPACGDFNAFKVTPRIIDLFVWIIENDSKFRNQQWTLNAGLRVMGIQLFSFGTDYWTVGMSNGGKIWQPGDPVLPPPTIKMHHANFAVGVVNKLLLLKQCLGMTKMNRRGMKESGASS